MDKVMGRAHGIARVFASLACSLMLALSMSSIAWADQDDVALENAGNVFEAAGDDRAEASQAKVPRDFVWAGRDLALSSIETGNDIIAAGRNLQIADSTVNGSVRIAGSEITLSNVNAKNNFTLAGKDLKLDSCIADGGVYLAGASASFSGKSTGAGLAAGTVILDGTVDGDAYIVGSHVQIGPNAVVTGTLKVSSKSEPTISPDARIGNFEFEQIVEEHDTKAPEEAAAALAGFLVVMTIISKIIGLLGTIVFAIVLAWLFRRSVEHASALTRVHAGRIFATGAITAVAAPLAFLILLCLTITAPIAFALLAALIMLTIVSVPFAAASFARLVFPKMNRFGAAAIGGAVLGIACIIPFLGFVISIAAFMYITGYAIQALWQMREPKEEKATSAAAPAPETAPAPTSASAAETSPVSDAPIEGVSPQPGKGETPASSAEQNEA